MSSIGKGQRFLILETLIDPSKHTGLKCEVAEFYTLDAVSNIGYLWVRFGGEVLKPQFFKKLSKIPQLKVLFLNGANVASADLKEILLTCPSLKALAFLNVQINSFDWPRGNERIVGLWITSKNILTIPSSILYDSKIETRRSLRASVQAEREWFSFS